MNSRSKNVISIGIIIISMFSGIAAFSQWSGGPFTQYVHTHRSSDGTGPIRTDLDMSVLYPSSTSTVKMYVDATTGNIYSSGSLSISGSTSSLSVSNVFATDVYVLKSVWASGSFYASGSVNVEGNVIAATGTFNDFTSVTTSGNIVTAGDITASTGTITAANFSGDGSGLTNVTGVTPTLHSVLNAGNTATESITIASSTFTGTNPTLTLTDTVATSSTTILSKTTTNSELSLTNDIYLSGAIGNAVYQTGATQYLSTANFTATGVGDWSASVWAKCTPSASYACAIGFSDAGATSTKGFAIYVSGGQTQLIVTYNKTGFGGNIYYRTCNVNAIWTSTEYHNIVVTHANGTDAITCDVDNTSITPSGESFSGTEFAGAASDSLEVNYFDGAIRPDGYYNDLRIYTRVLDATDKTNLYAGGAGTESEAGALGTNLTAHYSFNNVLTDSVGGYTLVQNAGGTSYVSTGNVPATADIISSVDGSMAGERGETTFGDQYGKTTLQGGRVFVNGYGALAFDNTSSDGRVAVARVNVYDTNTGSASFTNEFGTALDYEECTLAATTTTGITCTIYATDTTGVMFNLSANAVGIVNVIGIGRD